MMLRVLVFGPHAAAVGAGHVEVRLGDDRSCRGVLAALGAQHPGLRPMLDGCRLAVNARFAADDQRVSEGDEVALIGLVGGG